MRRRPVHGERVSSPLLHTNKAHTSDELRSRPAHHVEAVAMFQARTEDTCRADVDADALPGARGGLSEAGERFGESRNGTVAVRVCRGRGVCVIPVRVQHGRSPEHFQRFGVQPHDPVGGVRERDGCVTL